MFIVQMIDHTFYNSSSIQTMLHVTSNIQNMLNPVYLEYSEYSIGKYIKHKP